MGKVMSMIYRPIKNFNVESRAHKIISKDKPTPAPRYQANIAEAEKILRDNPDSLKELLRKDKTLDTHLKDIYVKSHDPVVDIKQTDSSLERPLPLNRKIVEQFEFGFHEPLTVPVGRCTLRQTLKFLTHHQEDSNTWNSAKIAIDYNMPENKIKSILHYFRIYKVYIPEKGSRVVIAEPSIPKPRLQDDSLKKLIEEEQKGQNK